MIPEPPRILSWDGERFPACVAWPHFTCAILESAPETRMVVEPSPDTVRAEAYDAGVLFGPDAEIRWRKRRNGRFHFVVIEDRETATWPEGSATAALRLVQEAAEEGLPGQVLLWGEPHGSSELREWYEPRIPKVLTCYPRDFAGSRVAVEMRHYRLQVMVPLPRGSEEELEIVVSRCSGLSAAVLVKES